jgi:hypothetical protein
MRSGVVECVAGGSGFTHFCFGSVFRASESNENYLRGDVMGFPSSILLLAQLGVPVRIGEQSLKVSVEAGIPHRVGS